MGCLVAYIKPMWGGNFTRKHFPSFILGENRYSSRKSEYFTRVGRTGGTIVNTNKPTGGQSLWRQTAGFGCFFIKRDVALDIHLSDEMWLEDTGYAWPDDRVFFYKAYLKGYKILAATDMWHSHNDAGVGKQEVTNVYRNFYTSVRNMGIFWYKYLYKPAKSPLEKFLLVLGLTYRNTAQTLFFIAKCMANRQFRLIFKLHRGYLDAYRYIKLHRDSA